MRLLRLWALNAALLAVAACGDKQESGEPAPLVVTSVTASDELGGFTGKIAGAAFWTHPTLAFNSLMVIADGAMLASYDIESGERIDAVETVQPSDVSIAYMGAGASAKGVAAIYDRSDAHFRFYAIDNIDRSFVALPEAAIAADQVDGFCLGQKMTGDGLTLHMLANGAVNAYDITLVNNKAAAEEVSARPAAPGLVDCVVDGIDGAVFAVTGDGAIYHYAADAENPDAGAAPFAVTSAAQNVTDIALSLNGLAEGGPTEECCGQLAILDGPEGHIFLYDRDDGHALGVIELAASFDVDGVMSASTMGVGFGNFGAAYRNGVLALATTQTPPVMRIAPWTGVLNALDQPVGVVANPRALAPQADEEDPTKPDFKILEP